MTKNIAIFLCISTTFMQGMETTFTLTSHGTIINLVKGDCEDIIDKTDIVVIGNHQHTESQWRNQQSYGLIGTISPGSYSLTRKKKRRNIMAMFIEEPRLIINEKRFKYYVVRKNQSSHTFVEDEAIKEASLDLALCYNNALEKGLKNLNDKPTKRITFTPLSTEVGFPHDKAAPIAIKTIFDFFEQNAALKNPGYDVINLVVKEQSDFTHYKLLLLQHSGILYNICLFWCGRQDSNSTLTVLLPELIRYILSLI